MNEYFHIEQEKAHAKMEVAGLHTEDDMVCNVAISNRGPFVGPDELTNTNNSQETGGGYEVT